MMLSLFAVVVSSMTIILQFDGSLRPPTDPIHGFTYSSCDFGRDSTSKNLDGSDKLSSCSSTISMYDGGDERFIAIGGRYLPNVPGMTSAHTEYDGLLLGLEWLVCAVSSEQEIGTSLLNEWNCIRSDFANDEHQILSDPKLIIRGDCKTVIDQLKSRSVPRKMEEKYNKAMSMIISLKEYYAEYQKTVCENLRPADVSIPQELTVFLEHVPRESNHFCDALCKLVVNHKQATYVESIHHLIRLGEEDATKSLDDDEHNSNFVNGKHSKKSKKKRRRLPTSSYFQQALDSICHTPQLCHSSRLALACKLTDASIRKEDDAVLSGLSCLFLQMSRRWSRIYYLENNRDSVGRDFLRKFSIDCDKLSKHFFDASPEGPRFAGSREVYDRIESMFDFRTKIKSQDKEVSTDATSSTDAMLAPYMEISELIIGVEVESLRSELRNYWYKISDAEKPSCEAAINSRIGLWKEIL